MQAKLVGLLHSDFPCERTCPIADHERDERSVPFGERNGSFLNGTKKGDGVPVPFSNCQTQCEDTHLVISPQFALPRERIGNSGRDSRPNAATAVADHAGQSEYTPRDERQRFGHGG